MLCGVSKADTPLRLPAQQAITHPWKSFKDAPAASIEAILHAVLPFRFNRSAEERGCRTLDRASMPAILYAPQRARSVPICLMVTSTCRP